MARNYAEELDAWVTQRDVTGREKNLVAFHAVRDDIEAALEAGFAAKTIWAHMRDLGRISYGYNTFRFYVNRFIKKPQGAQPVTQSGQNAHAELPSPSVPRPPGSASTTTAKAPAAMADSAASATSASVFPPPTPSSPIRRTGMPTFKFNPIPQREDNS